MKIFYKICTLSLAASLLTAPAIAHDAWIEPEITQTKDGALLSLPFYIGHAGSADDYSVKADLVSSFFTFGPTGISDNLLAVAQQSPASTITLDAPQSGTHIYSLNNFRSYIELEADKFNDYAKEEGITPIIRDRAAKGLFNTDGKESYSRHLKTIVNYDNDACFGPNAQRSVGQLLEIIPLSTAGAGDAQTLTVEVLYRGAPTAGVTLHMNDIDAGGATALIKTDAKGQAVLPLPTDHKWYIHAAWAQAVSPARDGADYLTAFTSLSIAQTTPNAKLCFTAE